MVYGLIVTENGKRVAVVVNDSTCMTLTEYAELKEGE